MSTGDSHPGPGMPRAQANAWARIKLLSQPTVDRSTHHQAAAPNDACAILTVSLCQQPTPYSASQRGISRLVYVFHASLYGTLKRLTVRLSGIT